ncbi:MAG: hypothetical protein JRN67_13875 [Nitrososphaerota archaeon]|nr:hypothetical protein [Nitrososphaerota archaeon]
MKAVITVISSVLLPLVLGETTVRIKTSGTHRLIDSWKRRLDLTNHMYLGVLSILLMAIECAKRQSAVVSLLILGVWVHFALVQFGSLFLLGFLLLKLQFYRLENVFLRLAPNTG